MLTFFNQHIYNQNYRPMQKILYLFITLALLFCYEQSFSQATCATAVPITVGTQQCGSSMGQVGDFPGDGSAPTNPCVGFYNDDEYWFSIVGDGVNAIQVDLGSLTQTYAGVFIIDNCPANGPNCITSVDNASSTADLSIATTTPLAAGVTYYIVVASWGAPDFTDFCLDVALVPPAMVPTNDECAAPIMVSVNADLNCGTVASGTTLLATETLPGCTGTANDDVWFSFVATDTTHLFEVLNVVAVAGTNTDMGHEIFSGTCGALTSLGCSDPNTSDISGLTVGSTYFVRVHSWGSTSSQTFDLCIGSLPPPPANDSCAIAEVLPVQQDACTTWTVGDNGSATGSSVPDPSCSTYAGGDLWYEVTVPASGNIFFDVQNVSWSNASSALYSGTCGALTEVSCVTFNSDYPSINTGLTPGTYYLRVWDFSNNDVGTFELCAYTTDCSITELAVGTLSACDPVTNTYSVEIVVTYNDAPTTGTLDVNGVSVAITTSPQTVLLSGLTATGLSIDVSAEFSDAATCALDSLDLYIAPMDCTPPPANDSCAIAEVLPVQQDTCATWTVGDNTGATDSSVPDPSCGDYLGGDMWFEVTVPASGNVVFDVQNVTWTSVAASLYSGPCATLVEEDCTEFASGWPFIFTGLTPGTYYLRTWDFGNNQTGTYEICATTSACLITELAAGALVDCDSVTNTYSQEIIVTYNDEPGSGTLDVNGQSFPITGSPQTVLLVGLTPSGLAVDVSAEFSASTNCSLDSTDLFIPPTSCLTPPANDECADAMPAIVSATDTCAVVNSGTTAGATTSLPTCLGFGSSSADVWFSFVATSMNHTFDISNITPVVGTSTDMVHEVFEGSCGTLTSLGCSDPNSSALSNLTIGTTYYVRVYSYFSTSSQTFDLCIATPIPCVIVGLTLGAQTTCDTLNGTYTQEVIVEYTDATSGTLDVNGQTATITTSPQTITLTGLLADGLPVSVTASISGDAPCTLTTVDLFTAPAACFTFPTENCDAYSSSPGATIDDANDPSDTITVSGVGMGVADLNVIVKIDHTFLGDLDVTLTSPSGTVVDLTFDNCAGNDDMEIEFDDEAASAIICGTPTIGVFTPDGNLSDFDGEAIDGDWILNVVDDASGDNGTLVQWCLIPELGPVTVCNLFVFTDTDEVSCGGTADGAATATPSFGTAPYTYQWDVNAGSQTTATAMGLAIGSYMVTVTDTNGCSDVAGVIVQEEPCDFCQLAEDNNTDICAVINADPSDPLANLDCDGDGATNGDECNDGTDPSDPCFFEATSVTEPVTADLSACANLKPDMTVTSSLVPNNIAGVTAIGLTINVIELNGVDAPGPLPVTVRMPSDPRFAFTWNTATNPDWNYLGDNGITHTWRYIGNGGVFPGGTTVPIVIGLADAQYDPQGTSGSTTMSPTVVPTSGGERNFLNNADPETLVYFK